jgi:hypothetical protein
LPDNAAYESLALSSGANNDVNEDDEADSAEVRKAKKQARAKVEKEKKNAQHRVKLLELTFKKHPLVSVK